MNFLLRPLAFYFLAGTLENAEHSCLLYLSRTERFQGGSFIMKVAPLNVDVVSASFCQ